MTLGMFHPVEKCMIPTVDVKAAQIRDHLAFLCGETRAKNLKIKKNCFHHDFACKSFQQPIITRIGPKVRII